MSRNPFKTPEFKALFKEWNQKLEEAGHQEIEDFSLPDAPLKSWHNLKWRGNPEKFLEQKEYYELATDLLHSGALKSELHVKIWTLHCEGRSVREIAKILNQKKLTRNPVHLIITEIQRRYGLRKD